MSGLSIGSLFGYLTLDSAKFDTGIKTAQEQMTGAQATATKLGTAVGRVEASMADAGREADVAARGTAKLRAAELSLVAAQERYNRVAKDSTASTGRRATAQAALIRADQRLAAAQSEVAASTTRATVAAKESEGVVAGLGSKAFGSAVGILKMAGGFAVLAAAFEAGHLLKSGVEFQSQMTRLVTAAGESESALKSVSAGVLQVSRDTGAGLTDLSKGMYVIESAGFHGADALTVLKAAAQGAQIELASTGEVADAVSSLLVDYHLAAGKAADVTSQLVAAVGHGKTTLQALATALPNVAAAANTVHVGIGEMAAALATMTMHGTDAGKAATYLRQMLGQLASGGSAKAQAVLKGLDIDANKLSQTLTSGSGHGLYDAISLIENGIRTKLTPAGLVAIDTFTKAKNPVTAYQKVLANLPPDLMTTFGALAAVSGGVKSMQAILQLGGENLATYGKNADIVTKALADSDGSVRHWAISAETARVKGDKFRAMIDTAAVAVSLKLAPALGNAQQWLGRSIPNALGLLYRTLQPTIQAVGTVFVGAVKLLGGALSVVAGALGTVGRFLSEHKAIVNAVTIGVLAMWAAWRAWPIAANAVETLALGIWNLAGRMGTVREGASSLGSTLAGAFTTGNVALAATGVAVGVLTYVWMKHAAQVRENKQEVQDLTAAIKEDSGALGENARAAVAKILSDKGIYEAARKAGLSLSEVTDAVMGNVDAFNKYKNMDFNKVSDAQFSNTLKVANAVIGQNKNVTDAVQKYRDWLAGSKDVSDAQGKLPPKIDPTTVAVDKQAQAVQKLSDSLNQLFGNAVDAADAELQFKDALGKVGEQTKQYGTSLSDTTDKGRANLEWLDSQIKSLENIANAQVTAGHSSQYASNWYGKNFDALRKVMIQAGFSKDKIDAYITSLHATPKDVTTALHVRDESASAKVAALKKHLQELQNDAVIAMRLNIDNAINKINDMRGALNDRGPSIPVPVPSAPLPSKVTNPTANKPPVMGQDVVGSVHRAVHSAVHGATIHIDAGSIGTLNGHIDTRAARAATKQTAATSNDLHYGRIR